MEDAKRTRMSEELEQQIVAHVTKNLEGNILRSVCEEVGRLEPELEQIGECINALNWRLTSIEKQRDERLRQLQEGALKAKEQALEEKPPEEPAEPKEEKPEEPEELGPAVALCCDKAYTQGDLESGMRTCVVCENRLQWDVSKLNLDINEPARVAHIFHQLGRR